MNTILRVYNQENIKYDLDLFQDQEILLDISAKEAGEIPSIFGIQSQQITLPATNNNNEYFGNLWNLGSGGNTSFTQRYPCQVLENGDEVFTGKIYLDSVVTDQYGDTVYNVVVLDEVVDFKAQIENLTWRDVFAYYSGSLGPGTAKVNGGWNHAYTYSNISQSWDLKIPARSIPPPIKDDALPVAGDIVYPLVEYGKEKGSLNALIENGGESGSFSFTNYDTPFKVDQFKPAIRVNAMWKALMRFTGYEYTSSFFDTDYFNTIYYLTTANGDLGAVTANPISGSFLAKKTGTNQDIPGNNVIDQLVEFGVEEYDNAGAYDPGTSTYTVPTSGEYGFQFSLLYSINNAQPTSIRQVVFSLYVNGARVPGLPNSVWDIKRGPTAGTFADGWPAVQLNAGDTVQLVYSNAFYRTAEFITFYGTDAPFFECYKSPVSTVGSTVDMSLQFGDETVKDWLLGMIQKFNLVIEPVKDQKNLLRVEPFNDWRDIGKTVDWTDKVDRNIKFEIKHPLQGRPKTVYFSDEEDDDDFNQYSIRELGKIFGDNKYVADTTVVEGEVEVGTFFAPTPMKQIIHSTTFIVPQIYTVDNSVGEKRNFKFKPRLLHYANSNGLFAEPTSSAELIGVSGSKTVSGSWFWDDQQGTVHTMTSYPQFHHISQLPADQVWESNTNPSTTRDLHFGNLSHWEYHQNHVNARTYRDAVYEYWAAYLNEIYDVDSRLLTCNVVLNPVEISQIELNDKIFIDGHYYRINKINGASLANEKSTVVELIRAGSRRNPYARRRVVTQIGGGGTGGSTGGGGGVTDGDIFTDDIIIGEYNSNGRVVYVNYDTGDTVTDSDLITQAAWKDGVFASDQGTYWYTPQTAIPTTNISLGSNYIDDRNGYNLAIGYYNNVLSGDGTNVVFGNNNTITTDGGTNVIFANNAVASYSTDVNLSESMLNNNFIVSFNNDGEKNLTNVSGGVILNPIKPISGSQYSDKVVAGNFISQGTASFEDSIVVTGSIILNGSPITGGGGAVTSSATDFSHSFATDPSSELFVTIPITGPINTSYAINYIMTSGSAAINAGQLQVTGDGTAVTVDKINERTLGGAPTSSFTAVYNTTNFDVKATFVGSDYVISGSYVPLKDAFGSVGPSGSAGGGTIDTGSFATTGSNNFIGDQVITGSLIVSGSSTMVNVGPAEFTGSVDITGSLTVNGNPITNTDFNVTYASETSATLDLLGWTTVGGNTFEELGYNLFGAISSPYRETTLVNYEDITTIGSRAFYLNNTLTGSITFPNLKYIGSRAFENNGNYPSFTSFTAPNCEVVGYRAFYSDSRLVSASLGTNTDLYQISSQAFTNCTQLKDIYIPTLTGSRALGGTTGQTSVFNNVPVSGSITIPSFYSSSNGGSPDGDLNYLITTRGWTVNYV